MVGRWMDRWMNTHSLNHLNLVFCQGIGQTFMCLTDLLHYCNLMCSISYQFILLILTQFSLLCLNCDLLCCRKLFVEEEKNEIEKLQSLGTVGLPTLFLPVLY